MSKSTCYETLQPYFKATNIDIQGPHPSEATLLLADGDIPPSHRASFSTFL